MITRVTAARDVDGVVQPSKPEHAREARGSAGIYPDFFAAILERVREASRGVMMSAALELATWWPGEALFAALWVTHRQAERDGDDIRIDCPRCLASLEEVSAASHRLRRSCPRGPPAARSQSPSNLTAYP